MFNSSQNLISSFLLSAWIETGSIVNPSSAVGCVQLVPKYICSKSETGPRTISEYFLWNNHTEGKWGPWWKCSIFYWAWPIVQCVGYILIRVYHKNTFFKNKISPTRQASAWGLVWRNPKGFLISTMFRGSSNHFRFDHFYIVDFHSALTFLDRDLAKF